MELCELRAYDSSSILVFLAEPRMQKSLLCRDSLIRVLNKQLLDKIFGRRGDVLPLTITEVILALHVLVQNFIWAVSFEERASRQDDVENDSYAKDICLTVVTLLL